MDGAIYTDTVAEVDRLLEAKSPETLTRFRDVIAFTIPGDQCIAMCYTYILYPGMWSRSRSRSRRDILLGAGAELVTRSWSRSSSRPKLHGSASLLQCLGW